MPDELEVHLFGANVGESILLGLPGGRWGLVDVHIPELSNPRSSALIRFLQERQVHELEFFCLTHPHADHIKGTLFILENFFIHRFLGFASIIPPQLYNQIVKVLNLKAARLHDPADLKEINSQLLSALALVKEKTISRQIVTDPVVVNYEVLNEPAGPNNPHLRMVALAPSGRSIDLYLQALSSCFDASNPHTVLVEKIPAVDHNLISSGFLLEYGTQRVVLGGDMNSDGWQDVLSRPAPGFDLASDLVKVSHHGSTNGYCPGLWERHLNRLGKVTALVTAFSPKGLPRPTGITYLKNNSRRLVTTSRSALKPAPASIPGPSPFADVPFEARVALEAVFMNARFPRKLEGLCSYSLSGGGECTERLSGDAAAL